MSLALKIGRSFRLDAWQDTYSTLHMWSQIVGKVRLALSPRLNHWWEVPLYVSAVGLTTSPIPYARGIFEIQFDFVDHKLTVQTNHSTGATMKLAPRIVADFYGMLMATLAELGIEVKIWPMPVEIPNPIPFDQDTQHKSYDPEYANRFWRILVSCDCVFKEFRARFIGKSSPSHFFWGSFDLAVSRFSGRRAPERGGCRPDHEGSVFARSDQRGMVAGRRRHCGTRVLWLCGAGARNFSKQAVRPEKAFYHPQLKEFLLMYDDLRQSSSPRATLLEFLQSTYEAGANTGDWNRKDLERTSI